MCKNPDLLDVTEQPVTFGPIEKLPTLRNKIVVNPPGSDSEDDEVVEAVDVAIAPVSKRKREADDEAKHEIAVEPSKRLRSGAEESKAIELD